MVYPCLTHPLGQRTYRRTGTPGASGRPYACRDTGHAGTRFAVLGHVAGWGRCGRAGDASACRHTHTWPRHAGWPGAACGESAHPRGVPGTPFRGLGHLVGRDGFRRVGTAWACRARKPVTRSGGGWPRMHLEWFGTAGGGLARILLIRPTRCLNMGFCVPTRLQVC